MFKRRGIVDVFEGLSRNTQGGTEGTSEGKEEERKNRSGDTAAHRGTHTRKFTTGEMENSFISTQYSVYVSNRWPAERQICICDFATTG